MTRGREILNKMKFVLGFLGRFFQSLIPPVVDPRRRMVRNWNQVFTVFSMVAIFMDPLLFQSLYIKQDDKCMEINYEFFIVLMIARFIQYFIYLLHILLQFRLGYISPEPTATLGGGWELVTDARRIAAHYLRGCFIVDFLAVLPIPEIMMIRLWSPLIRSMNDLKNFWGASVLVQYICRVVRFTSLLAGQSPTGFIFESVWANFVMNLLSYMLASHIIGSLWYFLGLQRVYQCLVHACHRSNVSSYCVPLLDCGALDAVTDEWRRKEFASACLRGSNYGYGIYERVVNLSTIETPLTRSAYSWFWGLQVANLLQDMMI